MSDFLLVSYYFPPVGGAGAQRPLRFARHLLDHGHRATVLTGPGETGGRWTPADETLMLDIPADVDVLRVPGPEPEPPIGLRKRWERLARRDSASAHWWQEGVVALGMEQRVDLIYTIMSPFTSAQASLSLSRRLGVGWVADLGDPWALDEMVVYPSRVHRWLEQRRMRRLLGSAAAIVMSTPEAVRQLLEAFPELGDRPVVAIPNGYDADDFVGGVPVRDSARFRIVHTGYLHTELGLEQRRLAPLRRLLGGGCPGVEILTRSHVYLLEAVERLLERDPGLGERLELHFAGVLSETDRALAARCPVAVVHGYVSHAESIGLMRSADLLFLPMQKLPPGRRSSTVPGKTYEYLASGRPILGAVPPGDAGDLLTGSGRGLVVDPDDVNGIVEAIAGALERPSESPDDPAFTSRFAYDNLADDVASVIDAAVARREARVVPLRRPKVAPERDLDVLMIPYHFPPVGGAGAQRSLKFARYLPENGCRPTVVTGSGSTRERWTPTDQTLLNEIPERIRVLRVPGPEPPLPARVMSRLHRWLRIRSPWARWWVDGVATTAAVAAEPDVVLSSSSPYDSVEAAARVARTLGKPWVADLRDPWALDEMVVYPSRVHRWLEQRRMRRLLGSAAAIVMSTPEAVRQLLEAFPELGDRPVVAIPNGYDADDFVGGVPVRDSARFRIVHTGYLHTELGLEQRRLAPLRRLLGGGCPGVEILTRSHVYLLEAVERLLERDPGLGERLELHFAGVLSETDRALAARCPVAVVHGYVSHAESIGLMRSADLLFLPMQKLPPGRRSSTVPGKTYEYLASGRPILGAVPPGDVRDLLTGSGRGLVVDPDDAGAMVESIAAALERHDRGAPLPVDHEAVGGFERRVLARTLADLLHSVAGVAAQAAAPAASHG